jgi:DNA-binding CsgD family transcriptional regulator
MDHHRVKPDCILGDGEAGIDIARVAPDGVRRPARSGASCHAGLRCPFAAVRRRAANPETSRRSRDMVRGRLTTAEYAIVQFAAQGPSYKKIAAKLNKSSNAIDNHLGRLRRKLGVHNKVALIRACAGLPEAG